MFLFNLFIDKILQLRHNKFKMERKRFYFEKNLFDGNNITLSGDEFHHMIDVMRIKPNESVVLFTITILSKGLFINRFRRRQA